MFATLAGTRPLFARFSVMRPRSMTENWRLDLAIAVLNFSARGRPNSVDLFSGPTKSRTTTDFCLDLAIGLATFAARGCMSGNCAREPLADASTMQMQRMIREYLNGSSYACATPPRNAATAFPSSVNVGIDCINRVSSSTSRTCPVGFNNFKPPPCRSSVTNERTSVLIPELSICETATKFTITSDGPTSANLRNSALNESLLVPIIIRPTKSIMMTLPDFRVEICRPMFASQAALATLLCRGIHQAESPPVLERSRQAAVLILTRAAKWPHYNPFR